MVLRTNEAPRAEICRFRRFLEGMGQFTELRLNNRLNGNFYTNHYIDEWAYYNFTAGSFHIKKFVAAVYSVEIKFYLHNSKSAI